MTDKPPRRDPRYKPWRYHNDPVYRAHVLEKGKVHYQNRKIAVAQRSKERRQERRHLVIEHYGGCCACCGETTFEFLGMDHVGGGGNKHRKEIGHCSIYDWLVKNGFPSGFRVMCHNCNCAHGFYGACPHQKAA